MVDAVLLSQQLSECTQKWFLPEHYILVMFSLSDRITKMP